MAQGDNGNNGNPFRSGGSPFTNSGFGEFENSGFNSQGGFNGNANPNGQGGFNGNPTPNGQRGFSGNPAPNAQTQNLKTGSGFNKNPFGQRGTGPLPGSGPLPGTGPLPGRGSTPGTGPLPGRGSTPGTGPLPGTGTLPGTGALPGGGPFPGASPQRGFTGTGPGKSPFQPVNSPPPRRKKGLGPLAIGGIVAASLLVVIIIVILIMHFVSFDDGGKSEKDTETVAATTEAEAKTEDNTSVEPAPDIPGLMLAKEYDGHLYAICEGSYTAKEARNMVIEGYHLATITSESEDSHILEMIDELKNAGKMSPEGFWLGADDVDSEGTFKWITGESFSYTRWPEGQPDNHDTDTGEGENYLGIWLANGLWNDFKEDYKLGYIIEEDTEDLANIDQTVINTIESADPLVSKLNSLLANSYEKDGRLAVQIDNSDEIIYSKFLIADIDNDGPKELVITGYQSGTIEKSVVTVYKTDNTSGDVKVSSSYDLWKSVDVGNLVFYDTGIIKMYDNEDGIYFIGADSEKFKADTELQYAYYLKDFVSGVTAYNWADGSVVSDDYSGPVFCDYSVNTETKYYGATEDEYNSYLDYMTSGNEVNVNMKDVTRENINALIGDSGN